MTTDSFLVTMKLTPHMVMEQLHLHGWNWRTAGAAFGLCFGILSPVVGSILTVISWFSGPHWHGYFIQRYGTVLFSLTIPLLFISAHCLDLIEKQDEAATNRRPKVE